jgi:hypothetical protein
VTTATRTARCGCGRTVPSDTPGIAFLERRHAGSAWAKNTCAVCNYAPIAHDRFAGRLMDVVAAGRWPVGVEPHEFVEHPGADTDTFYDGCRGWD